MRQELTHVGRISMMGQLAASLAHEINQPLGAILRNAEAAELFMQGPSPDLDEIRAIVADIHKDDQRAGNIIDRMRGLLKRQDLDTRSLAVGELVSEVLGLVSGDAAARQVKLDATVAADLPPVRCDRLHIQQVLVNLIVNGMDALDEAGRADRRVSVTAWLDGSQSVEIAVSDTGNGIAADRLANIFDPFITTKPNGLGMGMPISRTIIEALEADSGPRTTTAVGRRSVSRCQSPMRQLRNERDATHRSYRRRRCVVSCCDLKAVKCKRIRREDFLVRSRLSRAAGSRCSRLCRGRFANAWGERAGLAIRAR